VSKKEFTDDLGNSYFELNKLKVSKDEAHYFLPPYEWYNDSIALWTSQMGMQLVNYTPGTRSNADYTYPGVGNNYVDSRTIFNSVLEYEQKFTAGLNGFILLVHIGTDPRRTDKFYYLLPDLITELKSRGYKFIRIDELLD
jgi:peptidoglycan/xylan/chitin deacetylase (PgdA/CDA1 family)